MVLRSATDNEWTNFVGRMHGIGGTIGTAERTSDMLSPKKRNITHNLISKTFWNLFGIQRLSRALAPLEPRRPPRALCPITLMRESIVFRWERTSSNSTPPCRKFYQNAGGISRSTSSHDKSAKSLFLSEPLLPHRFLQKKIDVKKVPKQNPPVLRILMYS